MQEFAQDVTVSLREDRPGQLARVLEVVAGAGLNIEGYAAIEGLLHFVTRDASVAREALLRAGVLVRRQRDVLVVDAPNRVGTAARVFRRTADAAINVDFSYVAANDRVVMGADRLEALAALDLSSAYQANDGRGAAAEPTDAAATVAAFFESYRSAFERGDAMAIVNHFAFPLHVTSDAGEIELTPVATRQDWSHAIERLLSMYRAIGVAEARLVDLSATDLSPRLVQATVRWELREAAGGALYDFDATYTLGRIDDALRIGAIAHNEIPRYRACRERLHSRTLPSVP